MRLRSCSSAFINNIFTGHEQFQTLLCFTMVSWVVWTVKRNPVLSLLWLQKYKENVPLCESVSGSYWETACSFLAKKKCTDLWGWGHIHRGKTKNFLKPRCTKLTLNLPKQFHFCSPASKFLGLVFVSFFNGEKIFSAKKCIRLRTLAGNTLFGQSANR